MKCFLESNKIYNSKGNNIFIIFSFSQKNCFGSIENTLVTTLTFTFMFLKLNASTFLCVEMKIEFSAFVYFTRKRGSTRLMDDVKIPLKCQMYQA